MKFVTTSVMALLIAAPAAFAQGSDLATEMDQTMPAMHDMQGELIRTRDITGGTIYTMNEANDEGWNADTMWDAADSGWNQIGTIEDIVLTHDGQVRGIVAEVGGFLDIGDAHVMIPVEDLNLVAVDDTSYAYVTRYSEEMLEEMDSVDEGFWN